MIIQCIAYWVVNIHVSKNYLSLHNMLIWRTYTDLSPFWKSTILWGTKHSCRAQAVAPTPVARRLLLLILAAFTARWLLQEDRYKDSEAWTKSGCHEPTHLFTFYSRWQMSLVFLIFHHIPKPIWQTNVQLWFSHYHMLSSEVPVYHISLWNKPTVRTGKHKFKKVQKIK